MNLKFLKIFSITTISPHVIGMYFGISSFHRVLAVNTWTNVWQVTELTNNFNVKFLWSEKRLMQCFLTKFQIFVREGKQDYWESSGEWILWSWVAELKVYSFLSSAIPEHFVHDSFTRIPLSWVYHQSNAMSIWWNNCFLKANHKASRMCNTTGHVAKLNYWWVQYNLTVWNSQTAKTC